MGKVRGITVEVSADASKFNSQIKALSKETKATQTELNALQKGLELKFDSERFKQAQKVAQKALDETAAKTDALRARMANLEKAGAIDTDEYAALQRELNKSETDAIKLREQIERLNKMPLDNLTKQIDKVAAGFNSASQATRGLSMAAGGIIAAGGALTVKTAAMGAELDDLSLRLGISAEKVQELQYVAVQSGVDFEIFNKGLIKARSALLDLSSGKTSGAAQAMQKLGLSMSQFNNNEDMFDGVIEALAGMEDKTLQAAYANEIFGDKIANEMLPFLNSGKDSINKFKEEFAGFSSLSNEQVAALATLDDTLFKLKESLKYVALQVGASLAPLMQKLADVVGEKLVPKLQKLAEWFGKLTTEQLEFGLKALAAVAMISPLLGVIGKLTGAISGIIKILPALKSGLSSLAANPIVLIIAIVAALLAILYTQSEEFREAINRLVETIGNLLAPILDAVIGVLGQLFSSLMPILAIVGDLLGNALNMLLTALAPVFEMLQMLFGLLGPLLNLALLPLQMALTMLQVPLQLLGQLLNWIMPIFNAFAKVVEGVFGFVIKIINTVLGWVESAINWVIDKINGLIRGINKLGGWLGININEIQKVSLQISTAKSDEYKGDTTVDTGGAPTGGTDKPSGWYDGIDANYGGDTNNYEYDNSTTNTTQNVTVTIQNYAAEVDVNDLVDQINHKLAEAL